MSKKEVLKKTTAFLAALSFLMTNQNQCIYLMAEETTTSNTKVENSASTTTTAVSKKENNVTTTVANTTSDTTRYTEPAVTTTPEVTEIVTTTVPTEITTVTTTTTTPSPKYVYNITFIGNSFKDNKELMITALKSIGIREEYIEITENSVQAKLYNKLSRPSKDVRTIGSIYAKAEMSGYNITFTEYTFFEFEFNGTNIQDNETNQRLFMESIGVYDIDDTNYAILKSDFGKDFDYSKLIYTRSGRKAKVELKENVFSFTEYYDISPVIDYVKIPESIINNHVPYDTKLSLNEYYRLEDATTEVITVKNNLNYKDYKISEKTYSVEFESGNYKVDGQNPKTKKYSWLRDKSNNYNIYCEDEYIKSVTIYDGETAVYTEDFSDSMSNNCNIVFSTENLKLKIADNKVFTAKVETIPQTVSIPLYFFNPETNEWEHNDETDYRTFEVSNKGTITVPQRLQDENNIDKYLFITEINNALPQNIPVLNEVIKNILSENPIIDYENSMFLCYYSLTPNNSLDFTCNIGGEKTIKYNSNTSIHRISNNITFIQIPDIYSVKYITMDEVFTYGKLNISLFDLNNKFKEEWKHNIYVNSPPTFLNITGILDDSGNNYLDTNKYIYLDAHAPRFDLSTQSTHINNTKGEAWTNSSFKFDITVDDKFSVSAEDFGEELHNQLDGITSKTGKVIITDEAGNTHTFTKNADGTFSHAVTAPATAEGTKHRLSTTQSHMKALPITLITPKH